MPLNFKNIIAIYSIKVYIHVLLLVEYLFFLYKKNTSVMKTNKGIVGYKKVVVGIFWITMLLGMSMEA